MAPSATRQRGRDQFDARDWAGAYADLNAADQEHPLDAEDLRRLASSAHLVGEDQAGAHAWERAHHGFVEAGDIPAAARCAFWLGFGLLMRGEASRGGGWVARGQRLLDDAALDCVERGYLLVPAAFGAVAQGDFALVHDTFGRVAGIGERFGEPDLVTLARHGQGRALIRLGDTAGGVRLLDEAMVGVTSGEVSPVFAGIIYCSVIEACHEILDMRRAQEWTAALSQWCDAQPGLVPFRGQCLVHRAQILQLHGAWTDAAAETERACVRLGDPPGQPAFGMALYQRAELHRLRGDFAAAAAAYRQAAECGRDPQPGLALLRVAEGKPEAARAAIRRALDEAREPEARLRALAAFVDIVLAEDPNAARAAAEELRAITHGLDAPYAQGLSAQALGAVLLAEGDAAAALPELRRAHAVWERLEAPYEAASVRALIGQACRRLGDEDGAAMELEAARTAFQRLGAAPASAALAAAQSPGPAPDMAAAPADHGAAGLTARELEVLRLVAGGRTNRDIAVALVISEHTVARHVQNIFAKLDVASRTAAAAFAFEHDLI